jgi:uncharacterized protein
MHRHRAYRSALTPAVVAILCGAMYATAFGQATTVAPRKQTLMVAMRDGTHLATDVYLPEGKGPFPTLLVRLPYNKDLLGPGAGDSTKRGYALVAQDTRGRYHSEGANLPFDGDGWWDNRWDGYDTLDWVAKQPWCDGKIGTFGGSALGITQLFEAGSGSTRIAAQVIHVGAPSMYFDMAMPGGVFKKAEIEDWLRVTKHSPDALTFWTKHGTYDEFWQARDVTPRYRLINAPAVHVGGWYDIFTQGTIDSFNGYQTNGGPGARGKQKLIMGPWTHGIFSEKANQLTFPKAKTPPGTVSDQWAWFDHYLRGTNNGIDREPAVTYYAMGDTSDPKAPGNEWRTASTWPPPGSTATSLYLRTDRTVSAVKPAKADPLIYTYDPANPCPTLGGPQLTVPAGAMDQRKIEGRPDVLVFTSASLTEPVEVTGRVRARLWVSSDCPDTDFFVKVCDVYPDGRSFNICEGQLRARFRESFKVEKLMEPGKVYPLTVDLHSTSIVFNRGHRIRVHVTSSSDPGYDPNPNTGAPFRSNDAKQIAHNTLYVDARHPSQLVLPVAAGTLPR